MLNGLKVGKDQTQQKERQGQVKTKNLGEKKKHTAFDHIRSFALGSICDYFHI